MKNLLTYCTLLLLTANSLFAYNLPQKVAYRVKKAIVDSLGTEDNETEVKVISVKTINRLQTALKLTNPLLNDDVLFSNDNITVMKAHPNPSTVASYLDYKMGARTQAKITIQNLIGKVVDEFDLQQGEHKLKIPTANYNTGIYLYTFSINGKALKSQKLIVNGR